MGDTNDSTLYTGPDDSGIIDAPDSGDAGEASRMPGWMRQIVSRTSKPGQRTGVDDYVDQILGRKKAPARAQVQPVGQPVSAQPSQFSGVTTRVTNGSSRPIQPTLVPQGTSEQAIGYREGQDRVARAAGFKDADEMQRTAIERSQEAEQRASNARIVQSGEIYKKYGAGGLLVAQAGHAIYQGLNAATFNATKNLISLISPETADALNKTLNVSSPLAEFGVDETLARQIDDQASNLAGGFLGYGAAAKAVGAVLPEASAALKGAITFGGPSAVQNTGDVIELKQQLDKRTDLTDQQKSDMLTDAIKNAGISTAIQTGTGAAMPGFVESMGTNPIARGIAGATAGAGSAVLDAGMTGQPQSSTNIVTQAAMFGVGEGSGATHATKPLEALKPVKRVRLTPEARSILTDVDGALSDLGVSGQITSSWRHNPKIKSAHNSGEAVDIVTGSREEMIQHAEELRKRGFRAAFEHDGQVNANGSVAHGDHIHITLRPHPGSEAAPATATAPEQPTAAAATTETIPAPPTLENFTSTGDIHATQPESNSTGTGPEYQAGGGEVRSNWQDRILQTAQSESSDQAGGGDQLPGQGGSGEEGYQNADELRAHYLAQTGGQASGEAVSRPGTEPIGATQVVPDVQRPTEPIELPSVLKNTYEQAAQSEPALPAETGTLDRGDANAPREVYDRVQQDGQDRTDNSQGQATRVEDLNADRGRVEPSASGSAAQADQGGEAEDLSLLRPADSGDAQAREPEPGAREGQGGVGGSSGTDALQSGATGEVHGSAVTGESPDADYERFLRERPAVEGFLYHGSPYGDIMQEHVDPFAGQSWQEGQGFYTTESIDWARKYASGRTAMGADRRDAATNGRVNYIRSKARNTIDFDAPADPELWQRVAGRLDGAIMAGSDRFAEEIKQRLNGKNPPTNGEIYREMFDMGKEAGDTYILPEVFHELGYDAQTHKEGLRSGKPHQVTVFLSPDAIEIVPPEQVYAEYKKQSATGSAPVVDRVPTSSLTLAPEQFQYKLNHNDKGETGSLKDVTQWNDVLAGVVHVWQDPASGKTFVVNGHNRVAKALELGVPEMNVMRIDASSPEQARTLGALINISEGHGTPVDAAKLFRDSEMTPESLSQMGVPLRGDVARKGIALAGLHPTLFDRVATGKMDEGTGAVIGRELAGHPDLQVQLARRIEGKDLTQRVVTELAQEMRSAPAEHRTEESLFGTNDVEESLAFEKAKLKALIAQRLATEKRTFGGLASSKKAEELAKGGNTINVEGNKQIALEAAQKLEVFDALKNTPDLNAIFNKATVGFARAKGDAKTKLVNDVYDQVFDTLSAIAQHEAEARVKPEDSLFETPSPAKDVAVSQPTPTVGGTVEQELRQHLSDNAPEDDPNVMSVSIFGAVGQKRLPEKSSHREQREERAQTTAADAQARGTWQSEDPEVQKRLDDAAQKPSGLFWTRAKERIGRAWQWVSNDLPTLPKDRRYADIREKFRQFRHRYGVAENRVSFAVRGILAELNKGQQRDFTLKLVLDNMMENVQLERQRRMLEEPDRVNEPVRVPFGYTEETLARDHQSITEHIAQSPETVGAVKRYYDFVDEIAGAYMDAYESVLGRRPSLSRRAYFHQEVLKYAQEDALTGSNRANRAEVNTRRSWLRNREEHDLDFSTNFFTAMPHVMTELMSDTHLLNMLKYLKDEESTPVLEKAYEDRLNYKKATGRELPVESFLPDSHTLWSPTPQNDVFRAWSIPTRLATEVMERDMAAQLGLSDQMSGVIVRPEDLKRVLVLGDRVELALPVPVARTLDDMGRARGQRALAVRRVVAWWKWSKLFGPKGYPKYLTRNAAGDWEKALFNPGSHLMVPRAIADLNEVFRAKKAPSAELAHWMQRGGLDGLFNTAEDVHMGADELQYLETTFAKKQAPNPIEHPLDFARWWAGRYSRMVGRVNDYRESVLRYANYLSYLDQITKDRLAGGEGRPKNFGASSPDQLMGIKDDRDRAFVLSNELLGAYDTVSEGSVWAARYIYPFFRYKYANLRAYSKLFANTVRDVKNAGSVAAIGHEAAKASGTAAKALLVRSPFIALRVGKFVLYANALQAGARLWNTYVMGEDEKKLPSDIQNTSHLTFGTLPNGEIAYFNRISGFDDYTDSFFGTTEVNSVLQRMALGRLTYNQAIQELTTPPDDLLHNMWRAFGGNFLQGFGPIETAIDVMYGETRFPDITNPRKIRDPWEYMFHAVNLDFIYRALKGRPYRGGAHNVTEFFMYTLDPGEAAYNDIRSKAMSFSESIGKGSGGFAVSAKSNAAYYTKQALRYGDLDAAKRSMLEYMKLTIGDRVQSVNAPLTLKEEKQFVKDFTGTLVAMDPMGNLDDKERVQFLNTLSQEDRQKVTTAKHWLDDLINLGSRELPAAAVPFRKAQRKMEKKDWYATQPPQE